MVSRSWIFQSSEISLIVTPGICDPSALGNLKSLRSQAASDSGPLVTTRSGQPIILEMVAASLESDECSDENMQQTNMFALDGLVNAEDNVSDPLEDPPDSEEKEVKDNKINEEMEFTQVEDEKTCVKPPADIHVDKEKEKEEEKEEEEEEKEEEITAGSGTDSAQEFYLVDSPLTLHQEVRFSYRDSSWDLKTCVVSNLHSRAEIRLHPHQDAVLISTDWSLKMVHESTSTITEVLLPTTHGDALSRRFVWSEHEIGLPGIYSLCLEIEGFQVGSAEKTLSLSGDDSIKGGLYEKESQHFRDAIRQPPI